MSPDEKKALAVTPASQGELLFYQTDDGRTRVECRLVEGNLWLPQRLIAELFQKDVRTINEHLMNIYAEGELEPSATIRKFRIVQVERNPLVASKRPVSRTVDHFSLEAILAVGYRVRSARGTAFRQWATARLSEYLVKGFVLDDERMKQPPGPGVPDYFDELLERIRDIRASERRMYLRLREILALAADYHADDEAAIHFFQVVQNKLHFSVTGKTAPELIVERADAGLPNMGLTSWKGSAVRKADVTVAKNYLHEDEITGLNRIVVMFLDYAEDQAKRRRQVFLKDWETKLDEFLRFNERKVLGHAGAVSRESADQHAHGQYEKFEARRREQLEAEAERDLVELAKQAGKLPKRKSGKGK